MRRAGLVAVRLPLLMLLLVVTGDAAAAEGDISFGADALLGPSALLVGALIGVGVLWREDRRIYRERIAELRADRDLATEGWKAQTDANAALVAENAALARTNEANAKALKALATATAARARADGTRRRLADGAGR